MTDEELIAAAKVPIEAYNAKDWDATVACMADGYVYDEVATHRRLEGSGPTVEALKSWATAFPDSQATIHSAHVAGTTVILELTWKGTHTGPMMSPQGEIPATNKSIDMRAISVHVMEGTKIKEQRHYFDMMTMMTPLGLAG